MWFGAARRSRGATATRLLRRESRRRDETDHEYAFRHGKFLQPIAPVSDRSFDDFAETLPYFGETFYFLLCTFDFKRIG
jgi:hypothetical protein